MTPERYAQVQELFLQVCELGEPDRDVLLAEKCGEDTELRSEVEALLAHDDSRTLIQTSNPTVANVHADTEVQPVKKTVRRQLQTFGLVTKRLGPRGHLAMGALAACMLFLVMGIIVDRAIVSYRRQLQAETLQEILDAKTAGLEIWFEHEKKKVESWARSKEIQLTANQLINLASSSAAGWDDVRQSPLQQSLQVELYRLAGEEVDYAIWDTRRLTIADSQSKGQLVGEGVTELGASTLFQIFDGQSKILSYDNNHTITKRSTHNYIEPHVGVIAPIVDAEGSITGALLVHDTDARDVGSRILRMVQLGESGESYAFNREGVMLSQSRFADQLREIGLLPLNDATTTARVLHLRDPGGDLTAGFRPAEPLSARPLTKMARYAIAGQDGVDVDGYRDYRGVMVVGAWRWLDEHDVGLATEIDLKETEPGHWIIVTVVWGFSALLSTCLGVIVYSYYSILRLRSQLGEHRQLGAYTLERQIGEGGMGRVFMARHEFLKRPTAIKLLKPELVDKQSVARFEREASMTSQLMHPNTIDIYDYGVTPEGIFFLVMEYIDGISLAELVKRYGPLPPQRLIHYMREICGSLAEAHSAGIIHRDLKPQNIMVCRRGGVADVIKVLDFGLVKRTQDSATQALTATTVLAGTPQYIAPERLLDPGNSTPQTDIYSLGAVMFYLLTGREVFPSQNLADVLAQVMNSQPPRPADLQTGIPGQLDQLVVDCLAKEPDRRPRDVTELIAALDAIEGLAALAAWDRVTAARWWDENTPTNQAD